MSVEPILHRCRLLLDERTTAAATGTKGSKHTPRRGPFSPYWPIMKVVAAASVVKASSAQRSSSRIGIERADESGNSAPRTW
jgi:hypothetical protein